MDLGINPQMSITYDKDSDVVYITFGKSRPAIASEVEEGDFIRFDPATNEILGITLQYFSERYPIKKGGNLKKTVSEILPIIIEKYQRTHHSSRFLLHSHK